MPTQGPAWGLDSIWVIFAFTTSKVAAFSAPRRLCILIPSKAGIRYVQQLYTPYTRLRWDQSADALLDVSANDVAQFDHIAGFGRPLYAFLFSHSFGFVDQQ